MYASRNSISSEVKTVKADIKDLLQSGNYYCTEEIARELTKLDNGLDHLNFDDNLLNTSRTWQNNFDPRQTSSQRSNAVSALDQACAQMFELKNELNVEKLKGKQENELREKHQWAINNLTSMQQSINPYAYAAADRINQFGDHIGVTDRFTQYRNNKMKVPIPPRTRTQETMRLERARTSIGTPLRYSGREREDYGVMGTKVQFTDVQPQGLVYKGYRTIDSLYPRATSEIKPGLAANPSFSQSLNDVKMVNTLNAMDLAKSQQLATQTDQPKISDHDKARSAAERAGINVIFPGTTLYDDEYVPPNLNLPTSHFVINPRPDFLINGRPLAKGEVLPPTSSEYQSRYMWPQGPRSGKLPWLSAQRV